jgi:hypothetical protein
MEAARALFEIGGPVAEWEAMKREIAEGCT